MNEKGKTLSIFTLIVYFFLIAPLVIIALTAFGESEFLKFPPDSFSIRWFVNAFQTEMFISTFIISLKVAVISTFLALLMGIPASYIISRGNFKHKRLIESFFLSPVLIPDCFWIFTI